MRAIFMGDPIEDVRVYDRIRAGLLTKEFGANPDYWLELSTDDFELHWEHRMLLEGYRNPSKS